MSTPTFTTVRTTRTAAEADVLMAALRAAGLHPLELAMSDSFALAGVETSFPLTVPTEELTEARELLDSFAGDDVKSL
ncbi:MAG: hypothetical protein ABIR24_04875 [Verrucomicrobiota bacterium]